MFLFIFFSLSFSCGWLGSYSKSQSFFPMRYVHRRKWLLVITDLPVKREPEHNVISLSQPLCNWFSPLRSHDATWLESYFLSAPDILKLNGSENLPDSDMVVFWLTHSGFHVVLEGVWSSSNTIEDILFQMLQRL